MVASFDKKITAFWKKRTDEPREDPEEEPITEDSKMAMSVRILKRTLSLRNLKKTISLRNLKRTLSMRTLKRPYY